jgi:hypothetical protein
MDENKLLELIQSQQSHLVWLLEHVKRYYRPHTEPCDADLYTLVENSIKNNTQIMDILLNIKKGSD